MTVESKIYLVEDSFGNKDYAVCDCSSHTIQICGMYTEKEEQLYFESDAYHLSNWCDENGLKFKYVERIEEITI